MCPGSRSERWSTSRVMRTRPFTFVSKTVRSSSSVDAVNGSRPSARPAAFTRMSAGPAASTNALAARGVGDVERERDVGLEPLDAAGAADDPRALVREHARSRGADPAGGAGDDRGLARRADPWPGHVTPTAASRPLRDGQRDRALRDLAVLVAHGRVEDVALALRRLELRDERDGLVGRDPPDRLPDGDLLLAVVDARR